MWRTLPSFAREVRRDHGIAFSRQLVRFARRAVPGGYSPEEFYRFGWWDGEGRVVDERLLSWRAFRRVDARLNPEPYRLLTQHKYLTHLVLAAARVPTPPFLGLFHPRRGFRADGAPLRTPADLEALFAARDAQPVFKLAVGLQGRGLLAFGPCGDGGWRTVDGRAFDPLTLHRTLTADGDVDWLVQERVRHHPFFARYGPGGGKLRVVTLSGGETPVVLARMVGIAIGREAAVGGFAGSLLAGIDPESGALEAAIHRARLAAYPRHPVNGAPIAGEVVPLVRQAAQVALHAAAAIPWLRLIAWDLGLDAHRGWVVFEGNVHWGTVNIQGCSGGVRTPDLQKALARRA